MELFYDCGTGNAYFEFSGSVGVCLCFVGSRMIETECPKTFFISSTDLWFSVTVAYDD